MLPDFERAPKSQKRRSRRVSMNNMAMEPLRAQESWNSEVIDHRPRILREAEEMRDALDMELYPGFQKLTRTVLEEENFFSERTHREVYEDLNAVLHPVPRNKNAEITEWIGNSTSYFVDTGESLSASGQAYTGSMLGPNGYFEAAERRVQTSQDLDCNYSADFLWDIPTLIAESGNVRRRKVAQLQHGYEEEDEQANLVPSLEALTIGKTPRGQKRRSASICAKEASEYKPRGIRKSKR
ncbi:hypothetical protein AOL_s00007g75 [Orbilia oligospora ATCC 24927]|uniref:Uncharacterized protein n=1 Tax=Arthrobotrys oligospora (strain ATCC 24927 / CBS 115.81 / DSM 1491) TaxID=756982 RepID=G1X1B6_ARTOA|nr:hypothetical protein AOL_s00007g75 [Orbilia oligospora ATCC 24927]EGX53126.1 hypothetical protein AOL_s00007g75 [Orbilia oligospora ATCC 24927]